MLQYSYRPNPPPTSRSRRSADQSWLDYSPIVGRPPIRWPNEARVALWICPNILYYEYAPTPDPWVNAWARMTAPDVQVYGRQEYGARVGFWRLLEVLDKHKARCTAVVNSAALRMFPDMCAAAVERRWDFVGHGQYNTRFVYGHSPADELAFYRDMLAEVEDRTGVRMLGTGGPGPQSATENTPDLLAEAGFLYHADWFCDDQPFPLRVRSGKLISVPYSIEINDAPFLGVAFEADQFADAIKRQFDMLYREGAESGRVMCISVHPPLFGQPQRVGYLDKALEYILSFPGVWQATGAEIAQHYMTHHYDAMVAHLAREQAGRP